MVTLPLLVFSSFYLVTWISAVILGYARVHPVRNVVVFAHSMRWFSSSHLTIHFHFPVMGFCSSSPEMTDGNIISVGMALGHTIHSYCEL